MARRKPRTLVIDADVAGAAGGSDHPTSVNCRGFLNQVYVICHSMAWTDEIQREWIEHQSRIARKWRTVMEHRADKVKYIGDTEDQDLRASIKNVAKGKDLRVIMKDIHLIEAALMTDNIIISCDDTLRQALSKIKDKVGPLKKLFWINPALEGEKAIEWLKKPYMKDKSRRL